MRDGTIEATEIWKRFRLDERPTYLQDRIALIGDRLKNRSGESWRWALSDISFRSEPGESWALVGANGAGKSTLLKIISRVMYQTAGSMELSGRVGALIEVRAGIAPLLTGRENIYLTGSIMGLKRRDVARRFDEIVPLVSAALTAFPDGDASTLDGVLAADAWARALAFFEAHLA